MALDAIHPEPAPPSPCVGICLIDPASRRCRGCLRYIDEIAIWYGASAAEKRAILAMLAERRRLDQAAASESRE
jgi:uncharacterized protein